MDDTVRLIIDDSERSSDLLWVSGFLAGDPFTYVEIPAAAPGDRRHLVLSDLELGRGRREATVDRVHSLSELAAEARGTGDSPVPYLDVIAHFLTARGIERVTVPGSFPVRNADHLRAGGFELDVGQGAFFPDRVAKSPAEIEAIAAVQGITERVVGEAVAWIHDADVDGDVLIDDGRPLTVERMKRRIRARLLEHECVVGSIIVAPGDQGCDPHCAGEGPLATGQSIIIDVFPRHSRTRYWGDMTRTVVHGDVPDDLARMHEAVVRAQDLAFEAIRPGVTGAEVHAQVKAQFERDGYLTERDGAGWIGFFHGTGHGVGLDIHEAPRLSEAGGRLEVGMVMTVEPGLYYPGIGGVRLEDIVVVTDDGCRNLNRMSRALTRGDR